MRDDERQSTDEWTLVEQGRLDSLPRTRAASDMLRSRTLSELRKRGLVRHSGGPALSRLAVIAAAASLVFVAGGFVGYRLALTRFEAQQRFATAAPDSSRLDLSTNSGHVVWF